MENNLVVFNNPEFGEIRTIEMNNEIWLVGKDVANALGYSNASKAVSTHVNDEDKQFLMLNVADTQNGNMPIGKSKTAIINESGLYSLILSSKLPTAKQFKRWVTSEVLPSIRKQGYYSNDKKDLEKTKLEIQKTRADAMKLNAKTRAFKTLMQSLDNKKLSPIAAQVFGLKGLEGVFGVDVGNYLPEVERTYSAKEVGDMLGISANKVGRIANANGLKTPEYGRYVADKSKNSDKEVESFRYNDNGVKALQGFAW